jgi:alpha-glucosidase
MARGAFWAAAAVAGAAIASCGDERDPGAAASGTTCNYFPCDGTGGGAGDGSWVEKCRGHELFTDGAAPEHDDVSLTLPCGSASLRVAASIEGVLRLRHGPAGALERASYAVVDSSVAAPPRFGWSETHALVCTDDFFAAIDRATCRLMVEDEGGHVVLEDGDADGYFEGTSGEGAPLRGVRHRAAAGERFYGFGERTGSLDKRGRVLTFWNTDAYQAAFGGYPPDADPLYQSIPFFTGLRDGAAYGLFLDDTHRLVFDMAASDPDAYALTTEGGVVDQYVIAGPKIADVVRRYAALTGTAPLPARWSLGYHQSRWGYSPDTKVTSIGDELRARGIPADALWLDIQHMDGFRSWTWDPVAFSDPQELVESLSQEGYKTVAIVDPAIKIDPGWDVYEGGLAGGFFLREAGGAPYEGEVWPGPAVFPDFSSPDARAWWGSLVPRTLSPGVRGLWIDMNEPSNFVEGEGGTVPNELAAAGDGVVTTMAEMHNVYALNEARATYEGMLGAAPDRRPFVLTRAGYAGIQRYAAVWTGDAPSTWETLRTTLPMLLGMGLSGLPFVGSDVGGYSGGASPALFARWMQVGSISPFFRAHVQSSANDQEPWQFGTEVEDISRAAIAARYRLLPYLYSLAERASRTGEPILRPLVYDFQDDPATHAIDDEAMLGPWLLHAPALDDAATERALYLPPGQWFEERSGAIHDGGQSITVGLTLGALPTFVREGAIVPRMQPVAWSDEAPINPLYLDVYPSDTPSTFALYEDDGDSLAFAGGASSRVTYTLTRAVAGATLTASAREGSFTPPPRRLVVRVRRVDRGVSAVRLDGAELAPAASYDALVSAGAGYFYDDRDLSLVVAFDDPPDFELAMDYDPSIDELAPTVLMPFHVTVPPGTPHDAPIHIATSASGWTHQALAWGPEPDAASGLVPVPRGDWLFYKYTRGGWDTVEKWPGCVEATNRHELGAASPEKRDTVWAWADQCP